MKRSSARATTFWVALALAVIAAMLRWQKPLTDPGNPAASAGDPSKLPHAGFSSSAETGQQQPISPFAPSHAKPSPFGPRSVRYPLPFATAPRTALRAPKATKRAIPSLRAAVGETLSVSLTQYCLKSLTRRDHATRDGIVAADPRVFPLGREVDVFMNGQLMGRYLVDDTGLLIKGRILDIWVAECSAARRFGRRKGQAVLVAKDS